MHGDTGTLNGRFFKGSGTSQAAAVVSGAAALLLSQRPWLNPDQVKDILRRSAYDVPEAGVDAEGDGALDLDAAYGTRRPDVAAARVHAGGGSLDKARGTKKVKKNGVTLTGEQDIFGSADRHRRTGRGRGRRHRRRHLGRRPVAGLAAAGRDLGRDQVVRGDLGRDQVVRRDLGRRDLGRGDLGRRVLGRGDLGRSDLGRGNLGRRRTGRTTSGRARAGE